MIVVLLLLALIIYLVFRNQNLADKNVNDKVNMSKERYYSKYSGCDYDTLIKKFYELLAEIKELKMKLNKDRFDNDRYLELCGRFLACKDWIIRKEPNDLYLDSIRYDNDFDFDL